MRFREALSIILLLILILAGLYFLSGCTFNIYVLDKVKADIKIPASQPTEQP
ncbi:MAG: hypothetical protein AB7I42_24300 [Bradyrhizobium sp.]|uniref:hypothetical protein n=1 Tax=Bradyrhizobium sp. TaxID=376 RepID=UPI003D0A9653